MIVSMWHAYANRATLDSGTELLVTGGRDPVRVQTGDQITIDMPDNNRVTTVVVDRTQQRLLIASSNGPLVRLNASTDASAFADFKLSDGFSREGWCVR
jgi:hypothetical protein